MTIHQFAIMMIPVNILIGTLCGSRIKNFYLSGAVPVTISLVLNLFLAYILF